MTTAYTSLLGFALPQTGELSGTWGDTVNNSITQLVEDSVAGVATASVTSGNWTLTTTGSGAQNQARCAILIPTGTPGVSRNILAPNRSKAYVVVNQSDANVVLKGATGPTTGTTILPGQAALCAWNGSDFVEVSSGNVDGPASSTDNAFVRFDGTTGKAIKNSSGSTLDNSGNASFAGTVTSVGSVNVSGTSATSGDIRLYEDTDNGTNYVALKAPPILGGNITYILPNADGSANQAISTDGSGVLTFASYVQTNVANTFTAKQTFSGSTSVLASVLANAAEKVTVSATAASGTIDFDISTQTVLYYTSNSSANWAMNFRMSSGTDLNTALSTGECITVVFLAKQGSPAHYNNSITVSGCSTTVYYQGGTAWTFGNVNSVDAYTYSIIKTGSGAATVFASQIKFA